MTGSEDAVMLLVLNGAPAVGKSTLARRYADDHPLALVVDVDHLRSQLGRWQDLEESKLVARDLAVALTRAHLRAGHDVIVPQYLGRPEFLQRLARLADEMGAVFAEVVLTDEIARITERFRARRAHLATTGVLHPEADLDEAEVAAALHASNAELLQDAAGRGVPVVSVHDGPQASYRTLCHALPARG